MEQRERQRPQGKEERAEGTTGSEDNLSELVDPILQRFGVLVFDRQSVSSEPKNVCCDLSCFWVGEEQEPQTDT